MWVLKRTGDGRYVARAGSQSSYTTKLEHARTYPTREAAAGDACTLNEYPVDVQDLLERPSFSAHLGRLGVR